MDIKKALDAVGHEVNALLGKETKNLTYSSEHVYPDEETAKQAFGRSVEKLFAVNHWSNLPGITSTFERYDHQGVPSQDQVLLVGDYIRIELPAPGPLPDNWVRVVAIEQTDTAAQFTVVPSENPKPDKGTETAPVEHFFNPHASSTFRVEQQGNRLIAAELGRNEQVNNQESTAGNRGILNTLIAAGGWAFFQEIQWKKLTDYLVHLTD